MVGYYSVVVAVSRSNGVVPVPPELKVEAVLNSSVTVSWGLHPTGGSAILNYIVFYRYKISRIL